MYRLLKSGVLRKSDSACIPFADGNRDYEEYKAWLAEGNTPDPEDVPDPKIAIQAQIDQLERESMMNRGTRELQMRLIEKEAAAMAVQYGTTVAAVLAVQPFYGRLKELDDSIELLRKAMR